MVCNGDTVQLKELILDKPRRTPRFDERAAVVMFVTKLTELQFMPARSKPSKMILKAYISNKLNKTDSSVVKIQNHRISCSKQ